MHDLDTVGWGEGFSFGAYGASVGVRLHDKELLEIFSGLIPFKTEINGQKDVDRLFSVLSVVDPNTGNKRFNLYWDSGLIGHKLTAEELLNNFKAYSAISIAELSREKLFVHAGAVSWCGKAILMPGFTNAGKSTLVAELVKRGATYYSDEFAILDKNGLVSPYAKPLSLRNPVTQKQTDTPVNLIGGRSGNKDLPVGLIVFSQYKQHGKWRPQPVSMGSGVLHLLKFTHAAKRTPNRAMHYLTKAVRKADLIVSDRGEAKNIATRILEMA